MKALVISEKNVMDLCERPIPEIDADEVLIKTMAAGICGTDIHILNGEFSPQYPLIPCHEFSGEVAATGKNVTQLKTGDPVGAFPAIACGTCHFCRQGFENHCLHKKAYGVQMDGGFAEYVKIKGNCAYTIPELTYEQGAMIEPLGCVIYGIKRAGIKLASTVLIFGCGTIGMLHLQMCRISGASKIVCVDKNEKRLQNAKHFGADEIWVADKDLENNLQAEEPLGFDTVIDATGNEKVVESMIKYVKNTGTLLYFGVCHENARIALKPYDVFAKDIAIKGSFTLMPQDFTDAIALIKSGKMIVDPLISDRYPFEEIMTAFGAMQEGGSLYKTMIHFDFTG